MQPRQRYSGTAPVYRVCVCVGPPKFQGNKIFADDFQDCRGQQGVHSSAANEDSCGYSVMQIGTPICVPALFYVNYLH